MTSRYNLRKRNCTDKSSNIFNRLGKKQKLDDSISRSSSKESLVSKDPSEESVAGSSEKSTDSSEDSMKDFIDDSEDPDQQKSVISTLVKNIASNLVLHCENVDESIIEEIITEEMVDSFKHIVGKLPQPILTKEQKDKLEKIKSELKEEAPTIDKILSANMSMTETKHCLRMYDDLQTQEPGTSEYYSVEDKIKAILKSAQHTTKEAILVSEQREKELMSLSIATESIKDKILNLEVEDSVKSILYNKYTAMVRMPQSEEYWNRYNQLDIATKLPYNKTIEPKVFSLVSDPQVNKQEINSLITEFIISTNKQLDAKLFGLEKVKKQLMLLLNDALTSSKAEKAIALLGPPGTGKTSVAKAFAESVGVPFRQVSLGGAKDSSFIFGSSNVWVGAAPGIIVKVLSEMGSSTGVVLFDEVDKISDKDVQYALLHITDFIQNKEFRDKFLVDIRIDLSKLWFFYSLNGVELLDNALKDRLPICEIQPYNMSQKMEIVEKYMLPEILTRLNYGEKDVVLTRESIGIIVYQFDQERHDGLRTIKKYVKNLVSNINLERRLNPEKFIFPLTVTSSMLEWLMKDVDKRVHLSYYT